MGFAQLVADRLSRSDADAIAVYEHGGSRKMQFKKILSMSAD